MRDGNARISRGSDRGGDAGNNLEWNIRLGQCLAFLAAPAEDEGVSPLEPHDAPAGPRLVDQQRVNLFLRHRMCCGFLADIDRLRLGAITQ